MNIQTHTNSSLRYPANSPRQTQNHGGKDSVTHTPTYNAIIDAARRSEGGLRGGSALSAMARFPLLLLSGRVHYLGRIKCAQAVIRRPVHTPYFRTKHLMARNQCAPSHAKKTSRTKDAYAQIQIHIHKNLTNGQHLRPRLRLLTNLTTMVTTGYGQKAANPPWNGYCHSQRTSVQSLAVILTFGEVETSVSSKNQQKPTPRKRLRNGRHPWHTTADVSTGRKLGSTYLQRTFNVPDASDLSGTTLKASPYILFLVFV